MKKLSVLGIVVGAAVLSVAPVSIQPSPRNLVELSVNKAEALVYRRHHRRAYRQAYRSAYYGGYGYGVGSSYYGYGYPGYGYPGGGYYGGYNAGPGYLSYSGGVCPHLGMDWGKGILSGAPPLAC
jgi:hypothetical protein